MDDSFNRISSSVLSNCAFDSGTPPGLSADDQSFYSPQSFQSQPTNESYSNLSSPSSETVVSTYYRLTAAGTDFESSQQMMEHPYAPMISNSHHSERGLLDLSSVSEQYSTFGKSFPSTGAFSPALDRMSPEQHDFDRHRAHMLAQPGINPGLSWEDYLQNEWPGSPTVAEGAIEDSTTTTFHEAIREIDYTSYRHEIEPLSMGSTGAPTWPSVCFGCSDRHTIYDNYALWLFHAWTTHPCPKEQWQGTLCPWEGCTNIKKVFETHTGWIAHIKHVHLKHQRQFWCTVSDCRRRQGGPQELPFSNEGDLIRHRNDIHGPQNHCRKPFCSGRRRSKLNRPDKNNEHEARWHGPFSCTFDCCSRRHFENVQYGFSTMGQLQQHLQEGKHTPRSRRRQ